jgi:hypothetical protein
MNACVPGDRDFWRNVRIAERADMRGVWIFVLLVLSLPRAMAATAADVTFQSLASVTNDRNAHLQSLGLLLNAGKVIGVRFDTIKGDDRHAKDFSIDDVKAGAALDGRQKAIVLRGSIDPNVGNGELVIAYLSNAVFRRYRECHASMVRDENGRWHIVNVYNHKWVSQLVVKTRAWGISTIQGICPR